MLAAAGIALVLVVFLVGVVVVTMTLLGARNQRRERDEPVPESLPPKQTGSLLRQVADSEIELEIRGGRVINAIRLYQEKTGVDAREAKDAVEAWRERLRAS